MYCRPSARLMDALVILIRLDACVISFWAAQVFTHQRSLFPDDDLFPGDLLDDENTEQILFYKQSDTSYEDYIVTPIDRLQIRQEEGDVGVLYGKGSNTYVIEGNFLAYGKSSEELEEIAAAAFENIAGRSYRPCKIVNLVYRG